MKPKKRKGDVYRKAAELQFRESPHGSIYSCWNIKRVIFGYIDMDYQEMTQIPEVIHYTDVMTDHPSPEPMIDSLLGVIEEYGDGANDLRVWLLLMMAEFVET